MELCRLCHLETPTDNCKNVFLPDDNNLKLLEIVTKLTEITIFKDDPFPKTICNHCYTTLMNFVNFRQIVAQADQKFHEEFQQNCDEKVFIKQEIDDEDGGNYVEIVETKEEFNQIKSEIDDDDDNDKDQHLDVDEDGTIDDCDESFSILQNDDKPFKCIEFEDTDDGSNELGLVHCNWLSPRRKHVWWPPYKQRSLFDKALRQGETPIETSWTLFKVLRFVFEEDDLLEAQKKLERAEFTSDIQTGEERPLKKRKSELPKHIVVSESSEDDLPRNGSLHVPPIVPGDISVATTDTDPLSIPLTFNGPQPSTSFNSSTPIKKKEENDEFNKAVLAVLCEIKEQNSQIINHLKTNQVIRVLPELPDDIPIELPISNIDDLTQFEVYLSDQKNLSTVATYFSTLGGRDVGSKTNTILRKLLTNKLASKFSFLGSRNDKRSFSELNLKKLVIRAIQSGSVNTTENDINGYIKIWLKHSPKRFQIERQREQKL